MGLALLGRVSRSTFHEKEGTHGRAPSWAGWSTLRKPRRGGTSSAVVCDQRASHLQTALHHDAGIGQVMERVFLQEGEIGGTFSTGL